MSGAGIGRVSALWRYPVKSMMGEELNASAVGTRGLAGDRGFALVDHESGKVVSAKEPRKWARVFDFRAAYTEPPDGQQLPPLRVTLPDGATLEPRGEDADTVFSELLGHRVLLTATAPEQPTLEEYWPDIEGLDHRDAVTDEPMPEGTFFDFAPVHLLTTSTLDALRRVYPEGRFEVRRFRPNIVVETDGEGFVENGWVGRTLAIGDEVRLQVVKPCPRCVMTTLAQYDLPKDAGILRAAAQHNAANVGIYASVVRGGTIRRGDTVTLA